MTQMKWKKQSYHNFNRTRAEQVLNLFQFNTFPLIVFSPPLADRSQKGQLAYECLYNVVTSSDFNSSWAEQTCTS